MSGEERRFWDAGLETQSRAEWEALKLGLLQRHLQHAYDGSPYYRASFDAAGAHPDQVRSLDDLRRFPFINKQTLRERQLARQPFGDLVAVPERDIVYISASSGSPACPPPRRSPPPTSTAGWTTKRASSGPPACGPTTATATR
jgi:phenylacetate-CoA ligase